MESCCDDLINCFKGTFSAENVKNAIKTMLDFGGIERIGEKLYFTGNMDIGQNKKLDQSTTLYSMYLKERSALIKTP